MELLVQDSMATMLLTDIDVAGSLQDTFLCMEVTIKLNV